MMFLKPVFIFLLPLLLIITLPACTNILMTKIDKDFILAAERGDALAVQELLDKGADVNVKDKNGLTVLMRASWRGNVAIVKILLDKGAYVHKKNRQKKTALIIAKERGHFEIVKLLMQAEAKEGLKAKNLSMIYYLVFLWLVLGWYWYFKKKNIFQNNTYNLLIIIVLVFLGLCLWLYFSPKSYDKFVIAGLTEMFNMVGEIWVTISERLAGIGKSFFDFNANIPGLFKFIKVILGLAYWVVFAICWLISGIVLIVALSIIWVIENILLLLGNTVRFYYPKFNSNYFYNAMFAAMFLPPVYFSGEFLVSFTKTLGNGFELLLVSVFSFYDRVKNYNKGVRRMSENSNKTEILYPQVDIPQLPKTFDKNRIRKDLEELTRSKNKNSLKEYLNDFVGRYMAKGKTKNVQEYEKFLKSVKGVYQTYEEVLRAMDRVDRVEDTLIVERLRNENERRKLEKEQRLAQKEEEVEVAELNARKADALAKKSEAEARARKAMEPPPRQPQQKTRTDKIYGLEREISKLREAIAKNIERTLKSIEEEGEIRGLPVQEIEKKKDLERARWAKIEMEEIEKLDRKYGYR